MSAPALARASYRRTDGGTRPARHGVRAEIQALRAVAVVLVVVYHFVPTGLTGGYVGVDVFFVISGFLISRHLIKEGTAAGRIDMPAFWAGRVRRILPAALVTIIAIVVAATLLLSRTAAADFAVTSLWATLSGANWLFAAQAVDYAAQAPDASPFEHFWSLGVEEQFYLVWPLLVLLTVVLIRRKGRVPVRRAVLVPFATVFALSLAYGIWFTATGSSAAYFVTPTRMWELAAGGLLAAVLGDRQPPAPVAALLQGGGIVAVVTGALVYTAATPMPGVAALLPIGGAVAFIAGGEVPGLRRVWGLRPVRFLGDTSYSLYLWHWPVLVFARLLLGGQPEPLVLVGLAAGSLVLAALSYRFVEQPFRRAGMRRPLRTVAIGGLAAAVALGTAFVPIRIDQTVSAEQATARKALLDQQNQAPLGWPNLDAAARTPWARPTHVIVPDPAKAGDSSPFNECAIEPLSRTTPICVIGDTSSDVTIGLIGDSHMRQWTGVLDQVAKQHHWRIVTMVHNSCPFSFVPRPLELDGMSHCTQAVKASIPELSQQHVRMVLTSTLRDSYGDALAKPAAGYADMWRTLEARGIGVVALGDTPTPQQSPTAPDCVSGADPASCGVARSVATAVRDPLLRGAELAGVPSIDPTDAFCGTTWCPALVGNVLVYRDDNHVTEVYMESMLPWVERHIVPAIERSLASRTG